MVSNFNNIAEILLDNQPNQDLQFSSKAESNCQNNYYV